VGPSETLVTNCPRNYMVS